MQLERVKIAWILYGALKMFVERRCCENTACLQGKYMHQAMISNITFPDAWCLLYESITRDVQPVYLWSVISNILLQLCFCLLKKAI